MTSKASIWIRLVLAALATWRVTHLLVAEDGPADLIVRLRAWLGRSFAGKILDCFYCTSLWVAAPTALFVSREPLGWLFTWLALSGAACLLERVGHDPLIIQPLASAGEMEVDDVLRK